MGYHVITHGQYRSVKRRGRKPSSRRAHFLVVWRGGTLMTLLVDDLRVLSAPQRTLVLTTLAACSALLSNYTENLLQITTVANVNLLPGVFFGLVLATGIYIWSGQKVLSAISVVILTVAAWFLAVRATVWVLEPIEQRITGPRPPIIPGMIPGYTYLNYTFGLAGIVGGLVGSFLVFCAVAAVRESRDFQQLVPILCFGSAAGILLECMAEPKASGLPVHFGSPLPLFLVWQCGVAAIIAYHISPSRAAERATPHYWPGDIHPTPKATEPPRRPDKDKLKEEVMEGVFDRRDPNSTTTRKATFDI